jgi:hypothetical protein
MRRLFAGFWIGELGWELMNWQGYVRHKAKDYDEVIIGCKPGHEYIYSDFATDYVLFDYDLDEGNQWLNIPTTIREAAIKAKKYSGCDCVLNPQTMWSDIRSANVDYLLKLQPQKFVRYGRQVYDFPYDILIHARNRKNWDYSFRNWDATHALALVYMLKNDGYKIASIGTKQQAHHIEGTNDLRDERLENLVSIMNNAKLIISPISAPIHLASLCGLQQMTWATKQDHEIRVKDWWNVFNTAVDCITSPDIIWRQRIQWHPDVKELYDRTVGML